ncbi:MAG: dihydrodipicolinate synthase family protein [Prevotellaceae bacterium]|jgi:4-hydroxy-tetrahydrodipicolinate synthase|nr:dihydrodipicolinate synthase family protein [Prevotellaceae bacterium]
MKNRPLKGIIPPLVTPLLDSDTLDVDGLERLIEHVIAGGVHGLFILGTTGEAQSLSYRLRAELIERTCRQLRGRLPVLVGVSDTSLAESKALACKAADCGAGAVVSAPPFYYAPAQPELMHFYTHLAQTLPLPLFLYNMPSHTKVSFAPATVRWLSDNKNIIGIKDSSANGVYFQQVCYALRDVEGFSLLVGPEEMLAETVLLGGHGGVTGGANIFPALYVELYSAAMAKDFVRILPLQQKVMQVSKLLYNVGRYGSSYLKGVKSALSVKGICSDVLASPFEHFYEKEREQIRASLEILNFEPSKASSRASIK